MRQTLVKNRVTIGLICVALVLVLNILLLSYNTTRQLHIRDSHIQTYEILSELQTALSILKDAEAGQRAYLLTGEEPYLAPFDLAGPLVKDHLLRLRALTMDNPLQQQQLDSLEPFVAYTLTEFRRTTDLRRVKGLDAALRSVVYSPAKYKIADIERLIAAMERDNRTRLQEEVREAQHNTRQTAVTFAATTLIAFALLWFINRRLHRYIQARDHAEEALRVSEANLRQSQKMEAVGRLAGGIAHDFNNLLTVITGYSEVLLKKPDMKDRQRNYVEQIKQAGDRAASLTRQLLAFSRRQVLQPKVLDLNEAVTAISPILQRLMGEDIRLTLDLGRIGSIKADPGQLDQVLMNLAANARDAMPQGGTLIIKTADIELDAGEANRHPGAQAGPHVMLAVSDTGCGMDTETLRHIYEPFFTTKEQGKGTGLGLSTVYGIVKQSGGSIWAYSEPGLGTTFKIYLPRVESCAPPLCAPSPSALAGRSTETVLLVEDETAVRLLVRTILADHGYTVLEAASPEEALSIGASHQSQIHLLVTDVVMPGSSGRKVAERLAECHPHLKVLYMSGYTNNAIAHHGVLEAGLAFLQKPFTPDALANRVREVLNA
ncbi:MAG: response regulator [Nitrospirae bacterium]|nr:MAG: response regulator [Nitrospirota bacterium]